MAYPWHACTKWQRHEFFWHATGDSISYFDVGPMPREQVYNSTWTSRTAFNMHSQSISYQSVVRANLCFRLSVRHNQTWETNLTNDVSALGWQRVRKVCIWLPNSAIWFIKENDALSSLYRVVQKPVNLKLAFRGCSDLSLPVNL
jgi:hypothetical protein